MINDESETDIRKCKFCGEETDLADLDEFKDTWQQWECPSCLNWNDKQ